jgi:hypothetical protein
MRTKLDNKLNILNDRNLQNKSGIISNQLKKWVEKTERQRRHHEEQNLTLETTTTEREGKCKET